ncbi:MAG: hypothetical protein WDN31_22230 [Hyphomicrobium sp.]
MTAKALRLGASFAQRNVRILILNNGADDAANIADFVRRNKIENSNMGMRDDKRRGVAETSGMMDKDAT